MIELNKVQGLSQLQQFENMAAPREGALLIKVDKKAQHIVLGIKLASAAQCQLMSFYWKENNEMKGEYPQCFKVIL